MRMRSLQFCGRRWRWSWRVLLVTPLLAMGCGSTGGNDSLTFFRVTGFSGDGLTQADSIGATGANVDVFQGLCGLTSGNPTVEPFTQTEVNAVFDNLEKLDIQLDRYVVHVNDPQIAIGDFTASTTATIQGGRCVTQTDKQCAQDADCTVISGGTTTVGTCAHLPTTVSGLVLFDFVAKDQIKAQRQVWGQAVPVTITFFAHDLTDSYETTGNYTVTFDNFDNCSTASGGGTPTATIPAPTATLQPTSTPVPTFTPTPII